MGTSLWDNFDYNGIQSFPLCGFDYFEMKQIDICKRKVYDITEGHDDKVTCITVMANEKIATASHDSKIKIWT